MHALCFGREFALRELRDESLDHRKAAIEALGVQICFRRPEHEKGNEFRGGQKTNASVMLETVAVQDDHRGCVLHAKSHGKRTAGSHVNAMSYDMPLDEVHCAGIRIRDRIHLLARTSARIEEVYHEALLLDPG